MNYTKITTAVLFEISSDIFKNNKFPCQTMCGLSLKYSLFGKRNIQQCSKIISMLVMYNIPFSDGNKSWM